MRQVTEAERQRWLARAEFVSPAVEIVTATVTGEADLSRRLESALPDANERFAQIWPFFLKFLADTDWIAVWDDFCVWLAANKTSAMLGELVHVDTEDELAVLVDRYTDDTDEEE